MLSGGCVGACRVGAVLFAAKCLLVVPTFCLALQHAVLLKM